VAAICSAPALGELHGQVLAHLVGAGDLRLQLAEMTLLKA